MNAKNFPTPPNHAGKGALFGIYTESDAGATQTVAAYLGQGVFRSPKQDTREKWLDNTICID
jgi:hypothetical protein